MGQGGVGQRESAHSGSPESVTRQSHFRVRKEPALTQEVTAAWIRPVGRLGLQPEVISGEQTAGPRMGKQARLWAQHHQ